MAIIAKEKIGEINSNLVEIASALESIRSFLPDIDASVAKIDESFNNLKSISPDLADPIFQKGLDMLKGFSTASLEPITVMAEYLDNLTNSIEEAQ